MVVKSKSQKQQSFAQIVSSQTLCQEVASAQVMQEHDHDETLDQEFVGDGELIETRE